MMRMRRISDIDTWERENVTRTEVCCFGKEGNADLMIIMIFADCIFGTP